MIILIKHPKIICERFSNSIFMETIPISPGTFYGDTRAEEV